MDGLCMGMTEETIVCFTLMRGEDAIILRVQRQNEKELYYRTGKNMVLGFLMRDYCRRKDLHLSTRFDYGGEMVKENQTPQDLNMKDGDAVVASDQILCPSAMKGDPIFVMFRYHFGTESKDKKFEQDKAMHYLIGRNVSFEVSMRDYCVRNALDFNKARFLFDGGRLHEFRTPADYSMRDGDIIDVCMECRGC